MTQEMKTAIENLKTALAATEELKAYNEAKKAYDADEELNKLINEYNVQAALLETEAKKPEEERDASVQEKLGARIREIYDLISENKSLAKMREAEQALSFIVSEINNAVHFTIEPEAANCTHDCSTCGGCH